MTTKTATKARQRLKNPIPAPQFFDDRLRYRVPVAAQLLGISVSKLYAEIASGKVPAIRDGGNTFIPGTAIAAACKSPSVGG